ncbi:MAG: aminopeptidase, partial [Bacteroidaceae bacterium]|nr:aminopeptidase [Bacteroidaceae bacterium]
MNKIFMTAALACLVSSTAIAQEKKDSVDFTVVKENKITSIKDQNQSGTCWAYSALGFIEAELLRMGKG